MTNCSEIIINSPPKMIVSAYKPALHEISALLTKITDSIGVTGINFKVAFGMIEDIIKRYRIPYNIYASGIYTPATVLCTLVKWSMERNRLDTGSKRAHYDTSSIIEWTVLFSVGITEKQTPTDYPDYKVARDALVNEEYSSIEKLLIISKAISYFNPNEPNPELWPNDPKVMDIITMPPGDRARELAHQLFTAPNSQEVITDIADELIELYKDFLKDK